jgi:hypothetical protein
MAENTVTDTSTYFYDHAGRVIAVPREQVPSVVAQGLVPLSPVLAKEFQLGDQYGGPGYTLAAGALGMARGATLGLSDIPARALLGQEQLKAIDEAHPAVSLGSEIAGVVAPMLLTAGGAGAVETTAAATKGALGTVRAAARLTPVAATSRFARGIEAAVVGDAATASTIQRLAGRAAGSAVEGAVYGAGGRLSEDMIGDPNATAETLLPHMLAGALGGSVVGGALGALEFGVGAGAKTAKKGVVDLAEKGGGAFLEKYPAIAEKLGGPARGITEDLVANRAVLQDPLTMAKGEKWAKLGDDPVKAGEKIADFVTQLQSLADASVKSAGVSKPHVRSQFNQYFMDGNKVSADKVSEFMFKTVDPDAAYALEKFLDQTKRFKAADVIKARNQAQAFSAEFLGADPDKLRTAINFARTSAQNTQVGPDASTIIGGLGIGSVMSKLGMPGVGAATSIASGIGAAVKVGEALKNPATTLRALAALERAAQTANKLVEAGMDSLARGIKNTGSPGRGFAAAGIANSFKRDRPTTERQFEENRAQFQSFAQNADGSSGKLGEFYSDLNQHAPNTGAAIMALTAKAAAYLSDKLPQHPTTGPLGQKWSYSQQEMAAWNRHFEAVTKPMSVMKMAREGTIMPEHAEAIRTVYPELLKNMELHFWSSVAGQKGVPYKSRLGASVLFGVDMDGTMSAASIKASQQAIAFPTMGGKMPGQATQGGKQGKLTLPSRTMTPMQSAASRGLK